MFLSVAETWLKEDTMLHVNEASSVDYVFTGVNRQDRGGGVGVFLPQSISFKVLDSAVTASIEYHVNELKLKNTKVCIALVYCPPRGSVWDFFNIFEDALSSFVLEYEKALFLGDFNFSKTHSSWDLFEKLMNELNLMNNVTVATHISGNSLDLVLSNYPLNTEVKVDPVLKSDHYCLRLELNQEASIVYCLELYTLVWIQVSKLRNCC